MQLECVGPEGERGNMELFQLQELLLQIPAIRNAPCKRHCLADSAKEVFFLSLIFYLEPPWPTRVPKMLFDMRQQCLERDVAAAAAGLGFFSTVLSYSPGHVRHVLGHRLPLSPPSLLWP